jgi:hypothetical protein
MPATYTLSDHSRQRLAERCGLNDADSEFQSVRSIMAESVFLLQKNDERGLSIFRLFYLRDFDSFCVLVLTAEGSPETGHHHTIATVLNQALFETKYGELSRFQMCSAAKFRLGLVAYSEWSKRKFGVVQNLSTGRLVVIFDAEVKRKINVKVRSRLCEGFKMHESLEDTLAHPGALTAVHEQLGRLKLSLEDRRRMYFDSSIGPLSMRAHEALPCPHCGALPLETDLPARKVRPNSLESSIGSEDS